MSGEPSVPASLRALLARKAKRVEIDPEEPIRILAEWRPDCRIRLAPLRIPHPRGLAAGAVVCAISLVWLLSSHGKGDGIAIALLVGIWPAILLVSRIRRLPGKLTYRLTEHSIRLCTNFADPIEREVLFGWVGDVEVLPADADRRRGHVILWPHDCAHDSGRALDAFEDFLWRGLPVSKAQPFVLWNVDSPEEVAETIRRAVKSLPLNSQGAYR